MYLNSYLSYIYIEIFVQLVLGISTKGDITLVEL